MFTKSALVLAASRALYCALALKSLPWSEITAACLHSPNSQRSFQENCA
jgi:hypothetical protein